MRVHLHAVSGPLCDSVLVSRHVTRHSMQETKRAPVAVMLRVHMFVFIFSLIVMLYCHFQHIRYLQRLFCEMTHYHRRIADGYCGGAAVTKFRRNIFI